MDNQKSVVALRRAETRLDTYAKSLKALPEAQPKLHKRNPKKHLKSCECYECLRVKVAAYKARVEEMFTPRVPEDPEQMVPVRAHFRRNPRYLSKQPVLQQVVSAFAATLAEAFAKQMTQNMKKGGR